MTRADDLVAAWRLYRLLRAWRDGALAGHVWVRVDLHPGHAPTVRPRRYVAARSPRRDCRHGIDMAQACDACQGTEVRELVKAGALIAAEIDRLTANGGEQS